MISPPSLVERWTRLGSMDFGLAAREPRIRWHSGSSSAKSRLPMKNRLPPKKDVMLALLERAPSVFIHLDPRRDEVRVPPWFKKQPQLVLQVGMNMAIPIPDLSVDDDAVSCTLSFSRTPFHCWVPWQSVFALITEDSKGMVWPNDIPPEVAAQRANTEKQARPALRAVAPEPPAEKAARQPAAEAKPARKKRARKVAAQPPDAHAAVVQPKAADTTREPAAKRPEANRKRPLPPYLRIVK